MRIYIGLLLLLMLAATGAAAQRTAANPDSATFDPDGTAHITRVVPMPATVSPEAQKWLQEIEGDSPRDASLAERRARTDRWQQSQSAEVKRIFPGKYRAEDDCGRAHGYHQLAHYSCGEFETSADQPARRRIQFRFRITDRRHPHL